MVKENNLKIGEMPKTQYLPEDVDGSIDPNRKAVGIKAYSIDGNIKEFHWFKNYDMGNLIDEESRHEAAAFIARIKLEINAESAIGQPVDLQKSDPKTGHVDILKNPVAWGLYIEKEDRPYFNEEMRFKGVETEEELRRLKPLEFAKIFQKTEKVLPYPPSYVKECGPRPEELPFGKQLGLTKTLSPSFEKYRKA